MANTNRFKRSSVFGKSMSGKSVFGKSMSGKSMFGKLMLGKCGLPCILALLLLVAAKARPPISINVKEAEVHNVFRLLARAGAINIVVPEHVRGRITLHLEQVPWEDALNAVLFTAGLGQVQQENVLYIDTLANLQAQAKARAAAHAAQVDLQPTETQIIPLSYARADELKRIVEQSLSPRGTVTVDMRTNSLIITDVVNSRAFSVAP